jgi:hypothetical protein
VTRKFQKVKTFVFPFPAYLDLLNIILVNTICAKAIAPVRWQHPSHVAIVNPESKGKTEGNDWDTACGNFKTSISSIYITIKNVFVLFHYQNNFEINYSSDIWWRHLPAACNNFFLLGVSGNG